MLGEMQIRSFIQDLHTVNIRRISTAAVSGKYWGHELYSNSNLSVSALNGRVSNVVLDLSKQGSWLTHFWIVFCAHGLAVLNERKSAAC